MGYNFCLAGMRPPGEGGRARGLSRLTLVEVNALHCMFRRRIHGQGVLEAIKNLVGGVLQASVGLVELPGRLGGELAELVAIRDVSESSKNKI